MNKQLLIITYYWPPAGGPGVQRVLKFAKYLPEFGWEPVVLTVRNGEYPALDRDMAGEIPSRLPVYKSGSLEPYAVYRKFFGQEKDSKIPTFVLTEEAGDNWKKRLSLFIRGNIFIPDAKIGWVPFAVKAANRIIREHDIRMIFTSSPPQTVNLIGKKLSARHKIKWLADFRDPWTDIFYYHSLRRTALAEALDRRLERQALQAADGVVTVSPYIANLLQRKADNQYFVIPNGFDAAEFGADPPEEPFAGKFRILHTGHLAGNQNPEVLWHALAELLARDAGLQADLEIELTGSVHANVAASLRKYNLEKYTVLNGYRPHRELIPEMQSAAVLLFVIPRCSYSRGILTGKLFDYLGAGRPVAGIGPVDGDAAAIVHETRAGEMIGYEDIAGCRQFIARLYRQWKQGEPFPEPGETVQKYSRRNLTKKLSDILNRMSES